MSVDIDKYKSEVDQIRGSSSATSDDPVITVSKRQGYVPMTPTGMVPGAGQTVQELSLSQLQERARAWGAARSPQATVLANKMVAAGFVADSAASNSDIVAEALKYPVRLYQAYSAYGGQLAFDDWLDWYSSTSGGAAGGGRGGRATTTTVTMANERDLRSTADAIGAEVLGRAITEDEFERVLKKVRSAETAEPTVSRATPTGTVTESGLTAEGRKDLITEMLMKGPEAKEFAQATTMMDAFYQALSEGPRGS